MAWHNVVYFILTHLWHFIWCAAMLADFSFGVLVNYFQYEELYFSLLSLRIFLHLALEPQSDVEESEAINKQWKKKKTPWFFMSCMPAPGWGPWSCFSSTLLQRGPGTSNTNTLQICQSLAARLWFADYGHCKEGTQARNTKQPPLLTSEEFSKAPPYLKHWKASKGNCPRSQPALVQAN